VRFLASVAAAGAAILLVPAVALAHPLGNFTINHYAGIDVRPDAIHLDVVIDRAEIPTFQERIRLDLDEDGEVSDEEAATAREPECRTLARDLFLAVDGRRLDLALTAAGLSFPGGAGGLSTMRLVCSFVAPLDGGLGGGRDVVFEDRSFHERIGWREIVVTGSGTVVEGPPDLLTASPSMRLTEYPPERLSVPLAMASVRFRAQPGTGAPPEPFVAPDAIPIAGAAVSSGATDAPRAGTPGGAAPGGVASEIPSIFQATDLSPAVLLAAVLAAAALGAGHALTPGHGKSLMAAYLVGRRGTALHAAGLGLSVSVSHTAGIVLLGGAIVAAGSALPADAVVRWLPVVAATTITVLGGWMVVSEVRARRRRAGHADEHAHEHGHGHGQEHGHEHGHEAATDSSAVNWRSLFALGLAGGIVPSTSALVILLGGIAAGRPAFGLLLVVAFGLGMALVMSGIGLALVLARGRLERARPGPLLDRVRAHAPLAAAGLVLAIGLWLTAQSILAPPTL
jgi:nickel/cobalt exporter